MRNLPKLAIVLGAVLLLTGCLDVVHHVGGSGDDLTTRYRVTLSKSIFQLAESFGGEAETVPESEMNKELGFDAETMEEELPPGLSAEVKEINTEYDVGIDVSLGPDSQRSEKTARWLPVREGDSLRIPLFPSQEEISEGTEGSQEADAFLAGRKYRLILSRSVAPANPEFYLLSGTGDSREPLDAITLDEIYLIEIPLILWLNSSGAVVIAESR